jgi:hypothetical protein
MWVLAFPRERSIERANILRMDALDVRDMILERAGQAFGEHGDPILHTFAIPYDDLMSGKVQVFDASS